MTKQRQLTDPEILHVVNKAKETGKWHMEFGSKHPKLRHESGRMVTITTSPGDRRSVLNLKKHIKHVEMGLPGWGMGNMIMA